MTELELLAEYLRMIQKEKDLKLSLSFEDARLKKQSLTSNLKIAALEISNQKVRLQSCPVKNDSSWAHGQMFSRLGKYSATIKSARLSTNISRNQGLVIEDRLYGIITSEMRKFAEGHKVVPSHDSNLFFETDNSKGIDKISFAKFLDTEAQFLSQISPVDFIELQNYVDKLYNNFRTTFG